MSADMSDWAFPTMFEEVEEDVELNDCDQPLEADAVKERLSNLVQKFQQLTKEERANFAPVARDA